MISEMKNRPLEDGKPKSGGCGSVSGYCAGTEFGGHAEKSGNKWRCWWTWITNIVQVLVINISKYKNYYVKISHVQINVPSLRIASVHSGNHRISSARRKQVIKRKIFYGKTELNSHANNTVAGRNCVPICHTERLCDVALFSDMYEPTKDVVIIYAATGFTSTTGRQYIIFFCECLYTSELSHTLINAN